MKRKTFPELLIKWLSDTNLTQKEFAKKVGLTEATISRYAKGKRCPTYDDFCRMECIVSEILKDKELEKKS